MSLLHKLQQIPAGKNSPWYRLGLFVSIFLALSMGLGKLIIGSNLLYGAGFWVYGGGGKAVLFGLVVLVILITKQTQSFNKLEPFQCRQAIWGLVATVLTIGLVAVLGSLQQHIKNWLLLGLAHLLLWGIIGCLAVAVFGGLNLVRLYRTYKRQLVIATVVAGLFYGLFNIIYRLWAVLAGLVLHDVRWLLILSGLQATVAPPRTLVLTKFGVTIEQYCSGIESLALFAGLFTLIAVLDWQRFNHRRLVLAFGVGLMGLFGCNILRVYLLIVAGFYISPKIAFTLFHSYAGMVLFIAYFWLYWRLVYRWLQPIHES